jgi:hypothetical protein
MTVELNMFEESLFGAVYVVQNVVKSQVLGNGAGIQLTGSVKQCQVPSMKDSINRLF